jgi:hypothetical protein
MERSDHTSGRGFSFEPDDNVPDVVEFRCAGRLGPGWRERVGSGGDPSGGGEGEGHRRTVSTNECNRPGADSRGVRWKSRNRTLHPAKSIA